MPGSIRKRQGFRVRVGEREHEVEVSVADDGRREILVDGIAFEVADAGAHAQRVFERDAERPAQLEVTLASHGASARPSEAWLAGVRTKLEVLTAQEARLAAALGRSASGSGSGSLTAPMPGRVVKILVAEGEAVEHGAPVIIVEAMKMENELHAPITGTVVSVLVREGETVEAGQALCELAADEAPE